VAADLRRGDVVWAAPDPAVGREQAGHRPAVVVSSAAHLDIVTDLAIVVPVTTAMRGWPNHVLLLGPRVGLDAPSFAMTEQPRTIDRRRVVQVAGRVDDETLRQIDVWLRDFVDLPA
jgi:mRNA interferase MazF